MPGQDPAQQRSIVPNQTGQKNARLEKMENIFRRQEAGKGKKVSRGPGIQNHRGTNIKNTRLFLCKENYIKLNNITKPVVWVKFSKTVKVKKYAE